MVPPPWVTTPLVVLVEPSGDFEKTERWRVDMGDGDYVQTEVKLRGEISAEGGRGQVQVSRQEYNGQAESLREVCSWGPVGWEARSEELPEVEELGQLLAPIEREEMAITASEDERSLWVLTGKPLVGPVRPGYELVEISTESGRVSRRVAVDSDGDSGGSFALAGGFAWVEVEGFRTGTGSGSNPGDCQIEKVDLNNGRVVSQIPVCAQQLLSSDGAVWAVEHVNEPVPDSGRVTSRMALVRIEPGTDDARRVLSVPGRYPRLAAGGGSVWVSTPEEGLVRVAADNGEVLARFPAVKAERLSSAGEGPLWVLDTEDRLWQIDLQGSSRSLGPANAITREPEGYSSRAWSRPFAASSSGAWLGSEGERTLYRLDESAKVTRIAEVPQPGHLVMADGWLWVLSDDIARLPA